MRPGRGSGGARARPGPRRRAQHRSGTSRASLTRDERDRAETHALVTDQLLRRRAVHRRAAPTWRARRTSALDGSGYHRRLNGAHLDDAQRVIAAADCYQAMISDRPLPPGVHAPAVRRRELRAMSAGGTARRRSGRAGAARGRAPPRRRVLPLPAGLTTREAEVLRLLALGLTTKQVADRAGDLGQDRGPPRAAHLHEDRRLDARRRGTVRDRARNPRGRALRCCTGRSNRIRPWTSRSPRPSATWWDCAATSPPRRSRFARRPRGRRPAARPICCGRWARSGCSAC